VRFGDDADDTETFLIGSREEAETTTVQVYSAKSPLGEKLTGAKIGETRSYLTPTGKSISVTLLACVPFAG
jgi:transcription elongation factor GreA